MRTLVIVNPNSGSIDDLSVVARLLREHPVLDRPTVEITTRRDDARRMAASGVGEGFRRILAAGGDGTLNEVVNGVMSRDERDDVVVGLLPVGTGNDFARTLGLPLDLEDALDRISLCAVRRTDLVHVDGTVERWFVNASAGGFSGDVGELNTKERKASWGPFSYLRSALDVLPDPETYRVTLELHGEEPRTFEAVNVVVANGRTVAGGIPVAPTARLDDGLLDVVVVRAAPLGKLAGFASRCLVGRHLEHELVEHFRTARVEIRSEPPMRFNLDGELVGLTPLTYEVLPGGLRLLVPQEDVPGFGTSG